MFLTPCNFSRTISKEITTCRRRSSCLPVFLPKSYHLLTSSCFYHERRSAIACTINTTFFFMITVIIIDRAENKQYYSLYL